MQRLSSLGPGEATARHVVAEAMSKDMGARRTGVHPRGFEEEHARHDISVPGREPRRAIAATINTPPVNIISIPRA